MRDCLIVVVGDFASQSQISHWRVGAGTMMAESGSDRIIGSYVGSHGEFLSLSASDFVAMAGLSDLEEPDDN
jgi:hypothetical protein